MKTPPRSGRRWRRLVRDCVLVVAPVAAGIALIFQPVRSAATSTHARSIPPKVAGSDVAVPPFGCVADGGVIRLTACVPQAPQKPTLLIYGDSLTVLSEGATSLFYGAQYNIVYRAMGGTSLCDWTPTAANDRALYKPARVVIAFTGNSASCSGSDLIKGGIAAWLANYQRSLLTMRDVFAGLPISVVAAPAMESPRPSGTWYPTNGYLGLNEMYQRMCAEYGMHYNDSADSYLTPGHVFEAERPAFPGDGPLTPVRTSDGVHVLPAGALYYGAALGAE